LDQITFTGFSSTQEWFLTVRTARGVKDLWCTTMEELLRMVWLLKMFWKILNLG